jgi:hypothetical protein
MDNQHRKISGYRELSQVEIDLMNEIKEKGEELSTLFKKIDDHLASQCSAAYGNEDPSEVNRICDSNSRFWYGSAMADVQTGFMKLVRSVAQPTTF